MMKQQNQTAAATEDTIDMEIQQQQCAMQDDDIHTKYALNLCKEQSGNLPTPIEGYIDDDSDPVEDL